MANAATDRRDVVRRMGATESAMDFKPSIAFSRKEGRMEEGGEKREEGRAGGEAVFPLFVSFLGYRIHR